MQLSLQQSRPCSAGQSPAPGRGRVQGRAADTYNCKIFANGFYNFMLCNFGVSGEVAIGVGQSVLLELGQWSGELVSRYICNNRVRGKTAAACGHCTGL